MTSSTPDALWASPSLGALEPVAVAWRDLRRGSLLDGCTGSVPAGTRLLVASQPDESASLLVRMLAGLSPLRGGRVELAGSTDPSAHGWARRVAYLGPEPGIRRWMTPREALRLAAGLLELAPAEAARRSGEVAAWTGISEAALDLPVGRGGRTLAQRTGLATALLAEPEVLLLDEPLRHLDPEERSRLLHVPGARRTVMIASRDPASEAGLVTDVALLRAGRTVLQAPIGELAAAGLPLSMSGIVALAELGVRGGAAAPRAHSTAAAAR